MTRHLLNNSKGKKRLAWFSLAVMLSVWGNALALFVCPHMSGGSCTDAKEMQESAPQNDHCASMKSSSTHHSDAARSIQQVSLPSTHSVTVPEAVTVPAQSCSTCLMQAGEVWTGVGVVSTESKSYEKGFQFDAQSISFELRPITPAPFDHRDHGPPGSPAKIYTLINTYRI